MADDDIRCSFCTKHRNITKKLIAGHGVYICDECIDLCDSILHPERREEKELCLTFPTLKEAYDHYEEARQAYVMMLRLHKGVDIKED